MIVVGILFGSRPPLVADVGPKRSLAGKRARKSSDSTWLLPVPLPFSWPSGARWGSLEGMTPIGWPILTAVKRGVNSGGLFQPSNSLEAVIRQSSQLPPSPFLLQFTQQGHHRDSNDLKSSTPVPDPHEALSIHSLASSPLCFSNNRPGRLIPRDNKLPVIFLVQRPIFINTTQSTLAYYLLLLIREHPQRDLHSIDLTV